MWGVAGFLHCRANMTKSAGTDMVLARKAAGKALGVATKANGAVKP
jgi:hypothetical protein